MTNPPPHVDPQTGEVREPLADLVPPLPSGELPTDLQSALGVIDNLAAHARDLRILRQRAEWAIRGKDLEIGKLKADHEREAAEHPLRREIDVVHACWKKACKRRRNLSTDEVMKVGACVKRLGLAKCLQAIAGATYDPNTRQLRNGRVEKYDEPELVFRNEPKAKSFLRRAPVNWTPDPDRIAEIANEDVEWVRAALGARPGQRAERAAA